MRKMNEEKLPQKISNSVHLEEEEEEEEKEHRNSWIQEVTTGIREKGINNMEWIDRQEWRREMKLDAQKDVKTLILCTQIKIPFAKVIVVNSNGNSVT
jgi:hypothetical protein